MFEITPLGPISEIEWGDETITLPYSASEYMVVDDIVVVVLGSWMEPDFEFWEDLGLDLEEKKSNYSFELDNRYQNVVAFADGSLEWVIPEAPHGSQNDKQDPYYKNLWVTGGDFWIRNKNQRSYRVDPETGDLLEDIPANHLRLGGRTIEFDRGWVGKVLHHDDAVAVMLEGAAHPGPSGKNIHVFDQDGSELWWIGDRLEEGAPSDAPAFTDIWIDDGDLCGYATDGYTYRFDPRTGHLLDHKWSK